MRGQLVLFACLMVAGAAQAQTLSGQWCGMADQVGPGQYRSEWSARLLLHGATGQMHYPSLNCGGSLTFVGQDGGAYFYRERISYGRSRCFDGGFVSIEPMGATVRWRWNGSGARAAAQLQSPCPYHSSRAAPVQGRAAGVTAAAVEISTDTLRPDRH
jgi:hypothetical protein